MSPNHVARISETRVSRRRPPVVLAYSADYYPFELMAYRTIFGRAAPLVEHRVDDLEVALTDEPEAAPAGRTFPSLQGAQIVALLGHAAGASLIHLRNHAACSEARAAQTTLVTDRGAARALHEAGLLTSTPSRTEPWARAARVHDSPPTLRDGCADTTPDRPSSGPLGVEPEADTRELLYSISSWHAIAWAPMAAVDVAIAVTAQVWGRAEAARIAHETGTAPHRPPTATRGDLYKATPAHDDPARSLRPLLEAVRADLTEAYSVDMLAGRAHLSRRALTRHFIALTGLPPMTWVRQQRLDRAVSLLQASKDIPMEEVARRVGLSPATLRRHLSRRYGQSPTRLRES